MNRPNLDNPTPNPVPAEAVEAHAAAELPGTPYWRSIQQQADPERFADALSKEFPEYDPDEIQAMSRRKFMALAAASMALAGLTLSGCRRWPKNELAPYAVRPEGLLPGEPVKYASMLSRGGVALPNTVISFDGRPVKIESNGKHPFTASKTDLFSQTATLELYDPARMRQPQHGEKPATWAEFDAFAGDHFAQLEASQGEGLAVLSEPMAGPTAEAVRAAFFGRFPKATWTTWEPINRDHEQAGSRLAYNGRSLRPVYDLSQAKVVACLDADLLGSHPASPQYAAGWAKTRISADTDHTMSRVYVAEPSFTVTGTSADERLAIRSSAIGTVAAALAEELGVPGEGFSLDQLNGDGDRVRRFVKALAKDLKAAGSQGLVAAGPNQPAEVHATCFAINEALGAVGTTIALIDEPEAGGPAGNTQTQVEQITRLSERLHAGNVQTLVILGGNPAYDAPADLDFANQLQKAGTLIRLSLYPDETAKLTLGKGGWALPMAHSLESWNDGYAWDGSVVLQQPLIHPLFSSDVTGTPLNGVELLAYLANQTTKGYDLVRAAHRKLGLPGGQGFEKNWRTALHDGFVAGSAPKPADASVTYRVQPPSIPLAHEAGKVEVVFRPSMLHDGRFANLGWLQELPDPITKAVWENPVLLAYSDAKKLGLDYGDLITVAVGSSTITAPVYIMPGQAAGTAVLTLGYGRTSAGPVGGLDNAAAQSLDLEPVEVGTDMYPLRSSDSPGFALGTLTKAGGTAMLVTTTNHHLIRTGADAHPSQWGIKKRVGEQYNGGTIIRESTLAGYHADPQFAKKGAHGDIRLQLFEPPLKETWEAQAEKLRAAGHPDPPVAFNTPHAWGMAIDLTSCTGCSACVVACQAENNIPVVGKMNAWRSREMHWIRIDTYYKPNYDKKTLKTTQPKADWSDPDVTVTQMPVTCVQCENAPCEQVCPVAATVHDAEGLNTMVYNRCIGTRYCSNNCPYKVRRFNYHDYHSKSAHVNRPKPWLNLPDTQQEQTIDRFKRMMYNPDVTVRMRGVMEKCTYCTQRIKRATITAKNEWAKGERDKPTVKDGEIVTACQDACPTSAIVFGDLNDPNSQVSKIHRTNPRAYSVLSELNTRPRTRHLGRLSNPNPGYTPYTNKPAKEGQAKKAPEPAGDHH